MSDSTAADTADPASSGKPAVLIVGGLGYIGRHLAHHIHSNNLASTLRLVDKQLPQLASLAPEHVDARSESNFLQADASRPQSLPRIFDLPSDPSTPDQPRNFDYVFNCGGETRFSQDDEVYKLRSHALSLNIGQEAAKRNCRAFIELSTGTVYSPVRTPCKEAEAKTDKPHTKQAKWKLAAEEALSEIPNLRLCVLRLAYVYGPYATRWIGTQLALARLYQERSKEKPEKMKYLWSGEMRTNTVHIADAVRACWTAAEWRSSHNTLPETELSSSTSSSSSNPSSHANKSCVFNIVDHSQTSQSTMATLIHNIFGIETGFQNAFVNTFARLNLEYVVDDVNDDTLDDWAELQERAGVRDQGGASLSPFMEKEVLRDADLSLDGGRFERVAGFRYEKERITEEEVQRVIESYKRMGWWP
ncbi:hypothetical protein MBLNU230_g3802t1 [Neophaeotheca triangularis]